jgi:hypothetical protein
MAGHVEQTAVVTGENLLDGAPRERDELGVR